MKVRVRFTGSKGDIDEGWLQIGDRFKIDIFNDLTGKSRPAGIFEIMEIKEDPKAPALPK